ncbi:hypothetical protein WDU94_001993 [Cyamophila willieti]
MFFIRQSVNRDLKRRISIRLLYIMFQIIGFYPLDKCYENTWKYRIHTFYMKFQNVACITFIVLHLLNTFCRTIRHLPDFSQSLFEDVVMVALLIIVYGFKIRIVQIDNIFKDLEYRFNTADPDILQKSQQKAMKKFYMFLTLFFCVIAGMISEMTKTLSENELAMRVKMFGTKYPRRILIVTIWIPGIDESEMRNFVLIFLIELYLGLIFILTAAVMIAYVPMIAVHVEGQVQILCKYIQLLGSPHRDTEGNHIFFTDIMKNKYIFAMDIEGFEEHLIPKCSGNKQEMIVIVKNNAWKKKVEEAYEDHIFKQIIKFHQKMLTFVDQYMALLNPFVVIVRFGNGMVFSLALYQLITHPLEPSWIMFRCFCNFVTVMIQYYGFCDASETCDNYHIVMRRSLCYSNWFKCSMTTRRNIQMMLVRLYKPNHPTFYKGTVVFSKPNFVSLLKLSYQIVNMMRLKINIHH